jgi:hypothetical protein
MALSISPLIFGNSPYNTPLTPPLRASGLLVLYGFRLILRYLRRDDKFSIRWRPYFKGFRFDKPLFLLMESEKWAAKLEPYAMKWLFTENDFSDNDMDKFLEGLPGYISSRHTELGPLNNVLNRRLHFETYQGAFHDVRDVVGALGRCKHLPRVTLHQLPPAHIPTQYQVR